MFGIVPRQKVGRKLGLLRCWRVLLRLDAIVRDRGAKTKACERMFAAASQPSFLVSIMPSTTIPDKLLPPGAWDSHVHVVDEDTFPLHPLHPYRPKTAPLASLQNFHQIHGIEHACLVAFSVYHTDYTSILDALSRLDGKGRAVACIDPTTITKSELAMLHTAGVRGIRINMRTRGDVLDLTALKAAAACVRPLGWVVQLYISLAQVTELASVVDDLGVTVVVDHLGAPAASLGPGKQQAGYNDFMKMLRNGSIWTKLSGAYRFATLPDLDEYVVEILRAAPDRVVWASDWPHSGGVEANPGGDRNKVQAYRQVDDAAWIAQCHKWCEMAAEGNGNVLAKKIWVDNPRKLWQYNGSD